MRSCNPSWSGKRGLLSSSSFGVAAKAYLTVGFSDANFPEFSYDAPEWDSDCRALNRATHGMDLVEYFWLARVLGEPFGPELEWTASGFR